MIGNNQLTNRVFEPLFKGRRTVRIDLSEISLQGIQHLCNQQPFLATRQRMSSLGKEITNCDVSLTQGQRVS